MSRRRTERHGKTPTAWTFLSVTQTHPRSHAQPERKDWIPKSAEKALQLSTTVFQMLNSQTTYSGQGRGSPITRRSSLSTNTPSHRASQTGREPQGSSSVILGSTQEYLNQHLTMSVSIAQMLFSGCPVSSTQSSPTFPVLPIVLFGTQQMVSSPCPHG